MKGRLKLPEAIALPAQREISQADLLEILGTNRMTLLNWKKRYDFPKSRKIGRSSYFVTAEICEWLRERQINVVLV